MNDTQHKFIAETIRLAVENARSGAGGPFAALIVKNGAVIARGTNRVTSTSDPTAHAEIVAIREACKALKSFQLDGCDIYASCEPCPMCLGAIYWARPAHVYFAAGRQDAADAGFDDSVIYEEIPKPFDKRKIRMMQIRHEEFLDPFVHWKKKNDKICY